MLDVLEFVLSPLTFLIESIFQFFLAVTNSAGLSIILVSITVTASTYPLLKMARRKENQVRELKQIVDEDIAKKAVGLKGEEKFRVVEKIYKESGYHPIQSIALGAPLFIMLPFLLSALFAFSNNPLLEGTSFLFINDLSKPDGLLGGYNLLPFVMTGITIIDSAIRFKGDRGSFIRFLIIAIVLLILVYNFASGIVLYWMVSNLISMLVFMHKSRGAE